MILQRGMSKSRLVIDANAVNDIAIFTLHIKDCVKLSDLDHYNLYYYRLKKYGLRKTRYLNAFERLRVELSGSSDRPSECYYYYEPKIHFFFLEINRKVVL